MKNKNHTIEFNLDQIRKEKKLKWSGDIDHEWFSDCNSDFYRVIKAHGDFVFTSQSRSVNMSARFSFGVIHNCSRCHAEFEENITEDLFENYDEKEIIIDIFPLLREIVIMNEPIKILCPSCKNKKT